MDACRRIFSNSHGDNFIAAVSYLSTQVTEIFPNAQIEAKKNFKRKILEMNQQSGGSGHGGLSGRGRFKRGRVCGGRGNQGDQAANFDTFNEVNMRNITRDYINGD